MKIRMLSRILGTALVAGSVFTVSPAAFAEEGAAAPAQAETVQEQAPFDVHVVEEHMMATIARFEREDITALQLEATQELRPHLTAAQVTGAKAEFVPKWGARTGVGKPLMTAGKEGSKWYVVCEIAVGYKATAVIYRLTYDENMKLAGFLVR
ncbi:DUF3887 domain-containing protein [Selenomonas sp. oral taxon 920]|uniref:DUF3887 domain-containing protein n=1 Tax=Selenomonas sp. oral taxon 920 TaxID=1884263 RepID=UPI000840F123|nr:DUF3887 domain-containing protein [Selenomonas sp. oral taxon 920]AOH47148.1 DUF3887 domain-containing protein [Selenomonas sp. oral taxon 920]